MHFNAISWKYLGDTCANILAKIVSEWQKLERGSGQMPFGAFAVCILNEWMRYNCGHLGLSQHLRANYKFWYICSLLILACRYLYLNIVQTARRQRPMINMLANPPWASSHCTVLEIDGSWHVFAIIAFALLSWDVLVSVKYRDRDFWKIARQKNFLRCSNLEIGIFCIYLQLSQGWSGCNFNGWWWW